MSKTSMEHEFPAELIELGKTLAGKDFSKSSNKEAVFQKVQERLNVSGGDNIMRKSNKTRRIVVAAASFAIVCTMSITFMQNAFAQNLIEKIKNSISLGHITVVQSEPSQTEASPVPDELKGKIFDKDGKPIEVFKKEHKGAIYTANGEKIVGFANGEIITEAKKEQTHKDQVLEIKSTDDLNKYTCFKVILPGYLPEGYTFDRAEFYKDENGTVSNSKYINLYFTNGKTGKSIFMQQRFADEETAYTHGTDGQIEQVKINGANAVISNGRNIEWETGNVLYGLSAKKETGIGKSELIKIAESIK